MISGYLFQPFIDGYLPLPKSKPIRPDGYHSLMCSDGVSDRVNSGTPRGADQSQAFAKARSSIRLKLLWKH